MVTWFCSIPGQRLVGVAGAITSGSSKPTSQRLLIDISPVMAPVVMTMGTTGLLDVLMTS